MKGWARGCCVLLAVLAAGCGGGGEPVTPTLTVTLSPASVTVLVGSFVQFLATPSSSVDSATFTVNGVEGGNATVGTIDSGGLYQAPAVVPASTAITVEVTVANSQTSTSASDTTTVTLDSGVRVSIVPAKFTIGTSEQFSFATFVSVTGVPPTAIVSGVCDSAANPKVPAPDGCSSVTWSVTVGTIDSSNGLYTAPDAATTATATVTAKSIYDTARTATASVTIVAAVDPTLTSISNTVGAVGAVFQDIYLAGTNFISTTNVFLNGIPVPSSAIALASSSALRVRIPDFMLIAAGTFTFTAAQQTGPPKDCLPDPVQCQLVLTVRRPAIVGASPDTVSQGNATDINVNGGYFGPPPPLSPIVTAQFGGQVDVGTVVSARQLSVAVGGADVDTPGLVPITVASNIVGAGVPPAVVNVAVQPAYSSPPSLLTSLPVGAQPSAVAINTATGMAVVANKDSNDVTLINVAGASSTVVAASICTFAVGAVAPCPAAGPVSVAVDNLRNLALVANSTSQTVAVVDLGSTPPAVTAIIPSGATSIADMPMGIGINSLTGLAIVAYQTAGFASIIDLKQPPYAVTGLVAANTGAEPRVAVSPKLNWALVTPGGVAGSLSIVDLGRQNVNQIASASCNGGVVTITTTAAHTLRVVPTPDPVLITGVTGGTGFNGVFAVASVSGNTFTYSSGCLDSGSGGTASYALPVATITTPAIIGVIGVAINDETQKAILVDPNPTGTPGRIFSLLDQTPSTVTGLASPGSTAAAFNPLANIAVIVNRINSDASVIDPVTSSVLPNSTFAIGLNEPVDVAIDPGTNTAVIVNRAGNNVSIFSLSPMRPLHVLQVSRQVSAPDLWAPPEVEITSTLTLPATYSDQALTIIGSGFTASSVVRLDGTNLATTFDSASPRQLTATVPAATLSAGPRRYALDVADGGTVSNAASFTVIQSVDLSASGCSPQGVAIDSRRNLAVVSNAGCNNVALINLATGMGPTVQVGTNPQGVAVHTQSGRAVVANQGSSNASIVDVVTPTEITRVPTNPEPLGVAIDQGLGRAVVTASAANVINLFTVTGSEHAVTSLAVQARPVAVAVDPERHLAAVANTSNPPPPGGPGDTVSLVDLTQTAATEHIAANGLPAGIAFDPVSTAFLTATSLGNQVLIMDPVTRTTSSLRVGINPTSIAYNFAASTLVTTNSSSQTMTVVDFLERRVRAVLSVRPSGQFAVDIHPFSNLAVIADSAGNRLVLLPLPR